MSQRPFDPSPPLLIVDFRTWFSSQIFYSTLILEPNSILRLWRLIFVTWPHFLTSITFFDFKGLFLLFWPLIVYIFFIYAKFPIDKGVTWLILFLRPQCWIRGFRGLGFFRRFEFSKKKFFRNLRNLKKCKLL
jgi:hypothetical protein